GHVTDGIAGPLFRTDQPAAGGPHRTPNARRSTVDGAPGCVERKACSVERTVRAGTGRRHPLQVQATATRRPLQTKNGPNATEVGRGCPSPTFFPARRLNGR